MATVTATLSTETWLPVRGPRGAYGLVWSNNPALTHFASIVPLPSEECQRPVFLQSDSDVVAPFILTSQPYLTRQELCDATLEMNRSWALVAEAPGAAGSLKLISQCENTVDYITLKIVFVWRVGGSSFPGVTGGAAVVPGTRRPPPHSWGYSCVAVKSDFILFCLILKRPRVFKLGYLYNVPGLWICSFSAEPRFTVRAETSLTSSGCAAAPGRRLYRATDKTPQLAIDHIGPRN